MEATLFSAWIVVIEGLIPSGTTKDRRLSLTPWS
jgi:hypothetical protein